MDTNSLKRFAQEARLILMKQVSIKIDLVLIEESLARSEYPKDDGVKVIPSFEPQFLKLRG